MEIFMPNFTQLIIAAGYFGIFLIIFAESGFLLGFFFPGDSLIFTAGVFASHGIFNVWILFGICAVGAVLGDSLGYWTGRTFGPKIFRHSDSLFFKREYVDRTQAFYGKHGKKTIILARFVPIVRTFAPIMAGVGEMNYASFLAYNAAGGIAWPALYLFPAYFIGANFPQIENYFTLIVGVIIIVSVFPVAFGLWKEWKNTKIKGRNGSVSGPGIK